MSQNEEKLRLIYKHISMSSYEKSISLRIDDPKSPSFKTLMLEKENYQNKAAIEKLTAKFKDHVFLYQIERPLDQEISL